jgi:hypothetical protein
VFVFAETKRYRDAKLYGGASTSAREGSNKPVDVKSSKVPYSTKELTAMLADISGTGATPAVPSGARKPRPDAIQIPHAPGTVPEWQGIVQQMQAQLSALAKENSGLRGAIGTLEVAAQQNKVEAEGQRMLMGAMMEQVRKASAPSAGRVGDKEVGILQDRMVYLETLCLDPTGQMAQIAQSVRELGERIDVGGVHSNISNLVQ